MPKIRNPFQNEVKRLVEIAEWSGITNEADLKRFLSSKSSNSEATDKAIWITMKKFMEVDKKGNVV